MRKRDLSEQQLVICKRARAAFAATDLSLTVALAVETMGKMPLCGVRLRGDGEASGWCIWGGERSTAPDFFKPVPASQLAELCPQALPYLGLPLGYRFVVDDDDYEDIWYEPVWSQALH